MFLVFCVFFFSSVRSKVLTMNIKINLRFRFIIHLSWMDWVNQNKQKIEKNTFFFFIYSSCSIFRMKKENYNKIVECGFFLIQIDWILFSIYVHLLLCFSISLELIFDVVLQSWIYHLFNLSIIFCSIEKFPFLF